MDIAAEYNNRELVPDHPRNNRPGMNADELERVRQEIARVANQSLR